MQTWRGRAVVNSLPPNPMSERDPEELVLTIWPSAWDLPSFNPECLACILLLQLTLPDKFRVEESCNPDESPSGVSVPSHN